MSVSQNTTEEQGDISKGLFIDWHRSSESAHVEWANQMLVQHNNDEHLIISFFVVSPPIVFGEPETLKKQFENVESIVPECVARIAVTQKFAGAMVRALTGELDKISASGDTK